jgi:hypothetical protein
MPGSEIYRCGRPVEKVDGVQAATTSEDIVPEWASEIVTSRPASASICPTRITQVIHTAPPNEEVVAKLACYPISPRSAAQLVVRREGPEVFVVSNNVVSTLASANEVSLSKSIDGIISR